MDDIDIIKRVKAGDPESFSLLVEKYHKRLLNFIYRLIRDEKMVEDLGQEVFLSVYKSLETFNEHRGIPFSAWLFMIARNRCISELRKNSKRINIALDDAGTIAGNHVCFSNSGGKVKNITFISTMLLIVAGVAACETRHLYDGLRVLSLQYRKSFILSNEIS